MSNLAQISILSKEFLRVPFTADVDTGTLGDVDVAFTPEYGTNPEVWHPGTIEDGEVRVMLGPDDIALTKGTWTVWVRLVDSPEIPVEIAGRIRVF